MPNYNLTVTSKFQPLSYERYLQPYKEYGEAYNKQQQAYDTLSEDSSKWGDLLDPSSEAYGMWSSFQKELDNAATRLQKEGLLAGNRQLFTNVRKSYGRNIKAIEEADKKRATALALRDLTIAKDSSIEYKNALSIDDFLHGRTASNEALSGTTLRAETADMASKLGQSLYSNPSFSKVMNSSYWQMMQANGYFPTVLGYIKSGEYKTLPHGEKATEELNKLYNDIQQVALIYESLINRTQGYSQDALERLNELIFQGLYAGLEKPKYDYQRNLDYMTAAEKASNALGWANLNLRKKEFEEEMKLKKDALDAKNNRSKGTLKSYTGKQVIAINAKGEVRNVLSTENFNLPAGARPLTSETFQSMINTGEISKDQRLELMRYLGVRNPTKDWSITNIRLNNAIKTAINNKSAEKEIWYNPNATTHTFGKDDDKIIEIPRTSVTGEGESSELEIDFNAH